MRPTWPAPAPWASIPAGDIFIHGEPMRGAWHRGKNDWTAGCIAVSNAEIEEIWAMVPTGTQVTILA
jgi:lipoprotein-anchoring transpeptidase ErfK/SrfK